MDFLLALLIAIPVGLGVYYGLKWLEPRLAEGADERLKAADEKRLRANRDAVSAKNKDKIGQAVAKKNHRPG